MRLKMEGAVWVWFIFVKQPWGKEENWGSLQVDELAKALKAVDEALKEAESGLETVHTLPSAVMPKKVGQ
jgi:hypothetical protein